jgi:ferric-chelate reductase (NADPH)
VGIASRLADMAGNAFLTAAEVVGVERIEGLFTRTTLAADAFASAEWKPGAKVQIRPQRGVLLMRTFTPLAERAADGRIDLLCYTHGDGPGGAWFADAAEGGRIELLGPRKSIEPPAAGERVVFVGDESSVALACAFAATGAVVEHVVETSHPETLPAALAALGITGARVTAKSGTLQRAREAADATTAPYRLVVTGDAATVHAVRRDARTWTKPPAQVTGKAYWAEGRSGLD